MTDESDSPASDLSSADRATDATPPAPATWAEARPAVVPRPTYWPAGTAFGVAFVFWGIVTSPVVAGAGGLVLVISLIGWIGEMRHERE